MGISRPFPAQATCSFAYERAVGAWVPDAWVDEAPRVVARAMRRTSPSDAVDRGCAPFPLGYVLPDARGRPRPLCWGCSFLETLDNPGRNFPVALEGPLGPIRTGGLLAKDVAAHRSRRPVEHGWLLSHKGADLFYRSDATWACDAPRKLDGNVVTAAAARGRDAVAAAATKGDVLASGLLHWPCPSIRGRRLERSVPRAFHDADRSVVRVEVEACRAPLLVGRRSQGNEEAMRRHFKMRPKTGPPRRGRPED